MADRVQIPIDLNINDIKTGKVDTTALSKSLEKTIRPMVDNVNNLLGQIDASQLNKTLSSSFNSLVNKSNQAVKSLQAFNQAVVQAGKSSAVYKEMQAELKGLAQRYDDVYSSIQQIESGENYKFWTDYQDRFNNNGPIFPGEGSKYSLLTQEIAIYNRLVETAEEYRQQMKAIGEDARKYANTGTEDALYKISRAYSKLALDVIRASEAQDRFNTRVNEAPYSKETEAQITELNKLADKAVSLKEKSARMLELGATDNRWQKLVYDATRLRDKIFEVVDALEESTSQPLEPGNPLEAVLAELGDFDSLRDSIDGFFGEIYENFDEHLPSRVEEVRRQFEELTDNTIQRFSNALAKIPKLFDKLAHHGRKSTNDLQMSMKRLWKNFIMFGLGFRSMYFAVRRLRKTFIEAYGELAKNFPVINKELSDFKTALNGLKGSLVTAFQPIASVLIPILTSLINALNAAMVAIGNFFAVLTGQDFIYKATAAQTDYAESLDKTAGSAKKADKALAKFDTINILGSKSGSGGSGAGDDVGFSLEKATLDADNAISEFAKKVKRAWEKADFTEIGQIIADKLAESLNKINWASIKAFADKIGSSIGTFIAGAVSVPGVWIAVGTTIAEGLNTAITFALSALGKINFTEMGKAFSLRLSALFINIDWAGLGETLFTIINSVLDFLIGFLTGESAERLGEGIGIMLETAFSEDRMDLILTKLTKIFGLLSLRIIQLIAGIWENDESTGILITAMIALWTLAKTGFLTWLAGNIGAGLVQLIPILISTIIPAITTGLSTIGGLLLTALGSWEVWIAIALATVIGYLLMHSDQVVEIFKTAWDLLKKGAKALVNTVTGMLSAVMFAGANIVVGFANFVLWGIKSALSALDSLIGARMDGWNWIADLASKVGIHLNKANPLNLARKVTLLEMPKWEDYKIPALAQGAVIPPNAPFLATLGDQTSGTNIEAPLDTIVDAFRMVQGEQQINITFTGSLAQLGRVLKPVIDKENTRVGGSLIRRSSTV